MNLEEAKNLIEQYGSIINFIIIKNITLPEADILCCFYQGKQVNLKFDLVYGFDIEWLEATNNHHSSEILKFFDTYASKNI